MAKFPILALGDAPEPPQICGHPGRLETASISDLVIDDEYQRAISAGSARNIRRIIREFDWNKFTPVVGVANEDGTISVIDGQHRATAAATIGFEEVPCYLLSCSTAEAASAFAAINGNVTKVSPVDIWFAKLAAKDPETIEINTAMQAASVQIVRKKDGHGVGDTQSVNVLVRAYDFYGRDVFITTLQCITETGSGNPGLLIGAIINGVGRAIRTKSDLLMEPSKLFDLFDEIDLPKELMLAKAESARTSNPAQFILTRRFNAKMAEASK